MFSLNSRKIAIHDVAPRDGLQNIPSFVKTEQKIALINALSVTGLSKIEVTSFTSPKAIPGLADAEAVMAGITRVPGVTYAVLVPNARGCERALACNVDEINLVMSVSVGHSLANLRRLPEDSLAEFPGIVRLAQGRAKVAVSLSVAFGCPFDGPVAESEVITVVQRLMDMGIEAIALCDTTGMANPQQVASLCAQVRQRWPSLELTAHFHNTRGMGLANALAAFSVGVDRFDASLGGLGGCPYAPGATGNICTEDLVHMFEAMGLATGVDLAGLLDASRLLSTMVEGGLPGYVLKAGAATRRYPLPESARVLREALHTA